jgi:hypothetical protein
MLLARMIGNPERGTLLASAARTATTATAELDWSKARAAILFWNVTAVGTSNLYLSFDYQDPVSGLWLSAAAMTTPITTAANRCYCIGTDSLTALSWTASGGGISLPLSSKVRFRVIHGDASSWTYSLGYELIP